MILSVATMIGLPSITFAMLSMLAIILWHQRHQRIWLVLSAVALGLSLLIKLFTGFLAPIFILGLVIFEYARSKEDRNWLKILFPAVLWGLIFATFTLVLGLFLVGIDNIPQLITVHLAADRIEDFQKHIYFDINWHIRPSLPVIFLAFVGSLSAFLKKQWLIFYPVAWMVGAYLLLASHAPVWEHQTLLVTVPAVIPAAIAVVEAMRVAAKMIRESHAPSASRLVELAALLGIFLLLFKVRIPEPITLLTPYPSLANSSFEMGPLAQKFFIRMVKYAPETHWVVTDLPMYAFRAHLPVPPELAVISEKRVRTGAFTEQDLIESIRTWNPEQVLIGRFKYLTVEGYLAQDYRLIHWDDGVKLYIRNDLDGVP
jgi:hypothetical protein